MLKYTIMKIEIMNQVAIGERRVFRMSAPDEKNDSNQYEKRIRYTCPNCDGKGKVYRLHDNMLHGQPVGAYVSKICPDCGGKGFMVIKQ